MTRELAETEGCEAVTTRRPAERVEYSQPVLYSYFKSKDAIMTAVAVECSAKRSPCPSPPAPLHPPYMRRSANWPRLCDRFTDSNPTRIAAARLQRHRQGR